MLQKIKRQSVPLLSPLIEEYHKKGYLLLRSKISQNTIKEARSALIAEKWMDQESMIFEKDGQTPRSLYNIHNLQPLLIQKFLNIELVSLNQQLVGDKIYIYQSHINYKKGGYTGGGEFWWHSDFVFWYFETGMRYPSAISLIFFLDEANESNGALQVIPGSHLYSYTQQLSRKEKDIKYNIRHNLSVEQEEEYAKEGLLSKKDLKEIGTKPIMLKGKPGDVLLMDANLWHYSPENKSSQDRRKLFIIINALNNQPTINKRPYYLMEREVKIL